MVIRISDIECAKCGGPFDPHNEPHDVLNWPAPSDREPLWLCNRCGTNYTPEEIAEWAGWPISHTYQELGLESEPD